MTIKNKYYNRSRISEKKFREIVKYFSLDLNATQITNLTGLNRNTINKILTLIRVRIFKITKEDILQYVPLMGYIEVDESYFGAKRVKGKRGRGAKGKTIVFGLLKRDDRVYTQIIDKCDRATLHAIIDDYTSKESIINSDGWRGYNGLVDFGYKKHYRVDHSKNEFARGKSHVNGIESFWGFAKTRLSKFRGMNKDTFELHLKECEFRFNNRKQNLYNILLKELRNRPLN